MKKLWHTLLLSTALVTVSCSKSDEPSLEPKAEKQAKTFGLSLSVDLEDLQLGDDARLMSYDLEGDKKLMKINLLRIKNETASNLINNNKVGKTEVHKVPVHVFFKNKKTNALVYEQLFMDIAGEKSLYLPFTELKEVRTKFTDDNANDWYMKGVIGGTALPVSAPTYVHHCHDYIYDITDQTESFITISSVNRIRSSYNQYSRISLPFPMETPWTKVQFYYKEGHTQPGADAKRPEYPDALQKLRFQPLGSVMRLKISNQSSSDYTFQTFFYTPYRGGEKQTMGYLNNVKRLYDQPITEASMTDIQQGVRVIDEIGGGLHYHSTGSSFQKPYPITIAQGGARYVFFWITRSQNQVSETLIQPYLYNHYANVSPTDARSNSPIYLTEHKNQYGSPNNTGGVMVSTSKYKEGYTYFINSVLR